MRTASILLAMVVVLGFASSVPGQTAVTPRIIITEGSEEDDYTIAIGGCRFGFVEVESLLENRLVTDIYAGPFGTREVPFTATQGLVAFCVIVVAFITLLVAATMRWKRKQPNRI